MLVRVRLLPAAALLGLAVSACAPTMGPPPPSRLPPRPPVPAGDAAFSAADFAWSQKPGVNSIVGKLAVQPGPVKYTCDGAQVILTPETPWSRRRMQVLYKSDTHSALPADEVRARTPQAAPGDSTPFITRAICDSRDRFSYAGLPDGAWYVITIAKPVSGAGASLALMRRVITKGGKLTMAEL